MPFTILFPLFGQLSGTLQLQFSFQMIKDAKHVADIREAREASEKLEEEALKAAEEEPKKKAEEEAKKEGDNKKA